MYGGTRVHAHHIKKGWNLISIGFDIYWIFELECFCFYVYHFGVCLVCYLGTRRRRNLEKSRFLFYKIYCHFSYTYMCNLCTGDRVIIQIILFIEFYMHFGVKFVNK